MPQHSNRQLIDCRFEDHGDSVLEIFNDAILNTTALYEYEPRSKATIERWFSDKAENDFPVIGAINETDSLMGFASYGRFRPFPAFNTTIEHSIYIHQDFRGIGLGKLLLTRLIERAREQGYHSMMAAIDAENNPSIRLHKELGFQQKGLLPEVGFKFERWLTLALYQKILSE